MDSSFLVLEVKATAPAGAARVFSGLATTPALDRGGDMVDPFGVQYTNPVPLFLFHDRTKCVGSVTLHPATAAGVPFTATIAEIAEPGVLKNRCDEAWQSIKAGLCTAVSIGWRPLANGIAALANGVRHLRSIEVLEVSIESLPMNPAAAILAVKSLVAADHFSSVSGVTGHKGRVMTTSEQITGYENSRAACVGRMQSLMTKAAELGETLGGAESEEYDGLQTKVEGIDTHLARLRSLEAANVAAAVPVERKGFGEVRPASAAGPIRVSSMLPKGTLAARYCMALIAAKGSRLEAAEFAAARWRDTPEVALSFKAAVPPAVTDSPSWAGALVRPPAFAAELMELAAPLSVIGRLTGLYEVPFGVPVPIETVGATVNWVGQAKPKPVTAGALTTMNLPSTKIAGIIAFSEELARSSSPKAESVFRTMLVKGIVKFRDGQFLDPAVAPVAGINPGSVTNGIVGVPATADPAADFNALMGRFVAAEIPLSDVTVIMSESNLFALSMYRTVAGDPMFAGVGAQGGTIGGVKVLGSNAAGTNVIGLATPLIAMSDEGDIVVDFSREASLEMTTELDGVAAPVSLWQNNLIGIKAEQFIGWKRAKNAAVNYLTGAAYTPAGVQ